MNDPKSDRYLSEHTTPEDPLLTELDRVTHLRTVQPQMIAGHVEGKILELFSKMLRPEKILEIGTFTGYSALCLVKGLCEGGELHTVDVNDELAPLAASFFARSPYGDRIRQHTGSALEVVPRLGLTFDLVFIDGDKREYPDYYRMLLEGGYVRSGSVLLADNVLWYGKVSDPESHNDPHTRCIREFNRLVREDSRVENVIIPVRDGLTVIRVK